MLAWRLSYGAIPYSPMHIYGYTPCPISGHVHHTLWIQQISEDIRRPWPSKTSNHGVDHL